MSWCELENGLVCKGGVRAKIEMHRSASKQVQVSKCKQVSSCKYPSVSIEV